MILVTVVGRSSPSAAEGRLTDFQLHDDDSEDRIYSMLTGTLYMLYSPVHGWPNAVITELHAQPERAWWSTRRSQIKATIRKLRAALDRLGGEIPILQLDVPDQSMERSGTVFL